jgi:hypothetical protein
MLIASMDHSPQEIPNHRDVWHTSALLVSVSAEQWGWGETLGPLLNPQRTEMGGKARRSLPKRTANSAANLRLVSGNLRVLTHYLHGDPGVDVCDNLAGMLKDDLARGSCTLECFERPTMGGMYWEIHSADNV